MCDTFILSFLHHFTLNPSGIKSHFTAYQSISLDPMQYTVNVLYNSFVNAVDDFKAFLYLMTPPLPTEALFTDIVVL